MRKVKKIFLKILFNAIFVFIYMGLLVIYLLHRVIPFFPVLFLFDFLLVVGHPLFLRYILKRKWFECTKDYYLKIRYIMLPWLIMELMVLLYYHKATYLIIKTIIEEYN